MAVIGAVLAVTVVVALTADVVVEAARVRHASVWLRRLRLAMLPVGLAFAAVVLVRVIDIASHRPGGH
jgi:hypothetical protein